MGDVKSEGWKQLLKPHDAARQNSTSPLRRSSSWRRSGESGYYEGPVAQINKPPRAARPQSCIEGGTVDKWLQTLERLQSRPLQRQMPQFVDRTVSMTALPNEMTGSSPLCPGPPSLQRRKQAPSPCPGLCESSAGSLESLESSAWSERSSTVHIKPSPRADRAKFCSLAPVRFGWLPIQRRVILTDVSNNGGHRDNSRCQQKLKSPITPVLLSTSAKHSGSTTNDSESERMVRPESVGFRHRRTPAKTSPSLPQAAGFINLEGAKNGSQGRSPAVSLSSKVDTVQSSHAGPEPSKSALKDPTYRRASVPGSFSPTVPSSGDSGCARTYSSSISSITITSRKVTRTSSLPDTSQRPQSPMTMNNQPTGPPDTFSSHATRQRKALVVKVTEHRTNSKTTPEANVTDQPIIQNSACSQNLNHDEYDHPVVMRRKPTIVKMVEQRERVSREQPDTTQTTRYRHSYTEGLHATNAIHWNSGDSLLANAANPSPLNQSLTVSVLPGGNQWRSSMVNKSSVSLFLHNSKGRSTAEESNRRADKTPRRPLSCDASLFNHTKFGANAGPAFHNKSSPDSQKTNMHLITSGEREEARNSAYRSEGGNLHGVIPGKERFERDRALGEREEPVSGIKPLTLLKIPDDSPPPAAQAVLALNAAAVIANIKLQSRQRRYHNTPAETQTASRPPAADGKNNVSREPGGDEQNKTSFMGFRSSDVPPESPSALMTLRNRQTVWKTESLATIGMKGDANSFLQEALAIRRPDFIRRSRARVQALERRSRERQEDALQKTQSSPQRPEAACIQQQAGSLLKSKDRHKEVQMRSKRNYNQLPEVRKRREEEKRKKEEEKRKMASRTNRLRAELFKKKLLDQVLQRGNN